MSRVCGFLLSSAISRSRTAGNVVGSRLGLYFPFPADKTNTNNELGSWGMQTKSPTEIRAQDSEPLTSLSVRWQDPKEEMLFQLKKLPGKKVCYETSRTGSRMDPANTAVTDNPEQQNILNFATQKALQYLMLKPQCSDDNVVPGQTDEPGRRGADLKSSSLAISN